MDTPANLRQAVADHSTQIFGAAVKASAVTVNSLVQDTRGIYRVRTSEAGFPTLIAKVRSVGGAQGRETATIQTAHEFAAHTAVWHSMSSAGIAQHRVPKPVLQIPEQGMLFMEEAAGEPVVRALWRETFWPGGGAGNDDRIRRCGDWLHTFAHRAPLIEVVKPTPRASTILEAGRSRHHVYSLIGLSGQALVDAVVTQARRRLEAYRVEVGLIRRIEKGFAHAFRDFRGNADLQGNVHGKYSIADVLVSPDRTTAIDLEQAGRGSLYLDPAYFLFQIGMVSRWRAVGRYSRPATLRRIFLAASAPAGRLDEQLLDAFIAYYLVNSLRPGDGVAGFTARRRANRWIRDWLDRRADQID